MDLHELAPVSGRATGGRHRWRFERFTEVCQGLTSRGRSHPGLLPLANLRFDVSRLLPAVSSEPDVTATRWARKRKLLPHPGHQFRPGNSGCVVRTGFLIRVAAASRAVTVAPMPAGRGVAALANVPDRQRRDGFPQPVIRREYSVIAMPVLPWRRDVIGEVGGVSKRPYTICRTERFATSRSQGSGGAAGRAGARKSPAQGGVAFRGTSGPDYPLSFPQCAMPPKVSARAKNFRQTALSGHTTPTASAFFYARASAPVRESLIRSHSWSLGPRSHRSSSPRSWRPPGRPPFVCRRNRPMRRPLAQAAAARSPSPALSAPVEMAAHDSLLLRAAGIPPRAG